MRQASHAAYKLLSSEFLYMSDCAGRSVASFLQILKVCPDKSFFVAVRLA
jgi:hypothetical protein